ncbi:MULTISPECIES: DUF1629 domain-containing protein [unclassified Gilliamella]|uniref:imm11 family protein n=1 Tax=unclassified Gilliamella TaxID=2685620 RepID=UPI001307F35A|nr:MULTISPECIES: DUF1629 domain-containing protein [unclassified Gilliamella]MWP49042.1 hypothetical protein [Gilliamella sp. Lep-s35]MWP68869.1 hypothetical protein [Gilliamella sp. Lep-s5]MWP76907.1 hypothetical protein [Gilliamella sp. Lep-s21]
MKNTNNMNDFEYYFMQRKGDQAYPMIDILDEDAETVEAELGDPLPRRPVLADYLTGSKDFVTKRIADVMMAMNMEGVRIVPVELSDRKGGYIEDYYCIYVDDNTYEALDKTKSDYEYDEECKLYFINKVVLDKEVLKKIPLSKRLGWRLREEAGTYLYYKTVVDEIKKLEPTGVVFINIEEYQGIY